MPANAACNALQLYYIVNFCNGDGGDFGDHPIAFTSTRYLAGGAAFLASAISNVSCPGGQDGVAMAQTNGGMPPYQYLWSNGTTSQTNNALYAGTYSVTVTDNAACTSTGQTFVMTQDTIKPQLSCPPSQAICAGDTVQYPLPTVLDNCDLNGEQPELLSGLPSGSVFPLGLTSQVFQVSDAWGNLANCAFSVRVWPAPSVSIDTVVHDMNNSGTGSIAISIGGSSPFNYFWLKDGQAFPAVTEDLTGLHSGHYILQAVDSNGYSVLSETITVDNTVSTHIAPTFSASFRLMPNPVSTYFQIAYLAEPPVHLRLVQPNGEVVQEWSGQEVLERIRLDDIPAGIYFLKMETSKGYASVLRLVKVE